MTKESSLLIISFYFPPYNRVGGRRWAKAAKYLYKAGIRPIILAGGFDIQNSLWVKDIELYKENIYRVPIQDNRPYYKRTLPKNIVEKFIWKASMLYGNHIDTRHKRLFPDISAKYESLFLKKAIEIIRKESISHILISVGPYSYSKIILDLKRLFPKLNIGIDFRDYWEDNFEGLTKKQKQFEINLQKEILKNIDYLVTVNEEMYNYYKEKIAPKLVYLLPHCVDLEDIPPQIDQTITSINHPIISFLYGGSLYAKIDNSIMLFINFIKAIEKKQFKTNTNMYVWYLSQGALFEEAQINCRLHAFISSDEYFKKVQESDYLLLFLPDSRINAQSSKFFELVAMRKPILYFGSEGYVSKFITENNLGFHFSKENFDTTIKNFISNIETKKIPDKTYNINNHTFEYQTVAFLDFLSKNQHF